MSALVEKLSNDETDAEKWTDAFIEQVHDKPWIAKDKGVMLGWFANAIQAGMIAQKEKDKQ